MKCTFLLFAVAACLVAASVSAQDADYFEEDAPKAAPAPPQRPSLLRRGSLARPQAGKAASTTTTQAPKEVPVEEEVEEEEIPEGDDVEEEQVTSTEANRRLKTGVVRPFRSNDDLLAALKRRRAEAAGSKTHQNHESTSAPAAESQSADHSLSGNKNQGGRKRFNLAAKSEQAAAPAEDAPAPAPKATSRSRFSGRGLYKSNAAPTDNSEIAGLESIQQAVEVKPKAGYRAGQKKF